MQYDPFTTLNATTIPTILLVFALLAERIFLPDTPPNHPRLLRREFWSAVQPGIFLNFLAAFTVLPILALWPWTAPASDALYREDATGAGPSTTDAVLASAANVLSLSIILTCAVAVMALLFPDRPHRHWLANRRIWLALLPGTILTNCVGGAAFLLLAGTHLLT